MKYQFLYWLDGNHSEDDMKESIISAKSVRGACGLFIRRRRESATNVTIDHEVLVLEIGDFIDISNIKSIKDYVR